MVPAGLLNPLSPLKDVAAAGQQLAGQTLPEESIQRDWRSGGPLQRLWGPSAATLPFVGKLTGLPPRYSPTSPEPYHVTSPAADFFGLPPVTNPGPYERAAAGVGLSPNDLLYQTQEPGARPIITQAQGQFLGGPTVASILGRPDFQRLTPAQQEGVIRNLAEGGRRRGLATLAQKDLEAARRVRLGQMPAFRRKMLEEAEQQR
jgi:hypothetical protein